MSESDSLRVEGLENVNYGIKRDLWMNVTMSAFSHALGFMYFNGVKTSYKDRSGFILYNTIGLSFDSYTIVKLCQIRKNNKEIKKIKSRYGG
jgi:hypothetical protein